MLACSPVAASSRDTLTIEAHNLEQSWVKEQGRSLTASTHGCCGPSPSSVLSAARWSGSGRR